MDLYLPADEFILFNERDPDLATIKVGLPKPPPYHTISGYGLHPLEQKFKVPEMPEPLAYLNSKRYTDVEMYWEEIERRFDYYEPHLWFIREHWERRQNGFWLFIKGKPTYIPPWHYYYLTAADLNSEIDNRSNYGINHPEYRARDRKFFLFSHWCDDNPFVFGFNYPKHRREGATSKASAINNELATRSLGRHNAIQSMTEPDAKDKVYLQFVLPMLLAQPFYFMPIAEDYRTPIAGMKYKPGKKTRYRDQMPEVLNSIQSYRKSNRSAYDGDKLRFHHGDEEGKTVEEDVLARWRVNRKALSTGNGRTIIGLHIATSTVGEMDRQGGRHFKRKCVDSNWAKRDETGQTETGLVTMFMPAEEGLEGFIDPWGDSVIEDPTPAELEHLPELRKLADELVAQYAENGIIKEVRYMGARSYIEARRNMYKETGKNDALSEEMRQTPQKFRECFTMNADECRFNAIIIQTRLQEFIAGNNEFVGHGTFSWDKRWEGWNVMDPRTLPRLEDVINGKAHVIFKPTPDTFNADWEVSYLPKEGMKMRYDYDSGLHVPDNIQFFGAGSDPQKVRAKTTSGKASLSSTAIFRKKNSAIDLPKWGPYDKVMDPKDAILHGRKLGDHYHVTDRFCALYNKRPTIKEDYAEQTLMACLYYGCRNNPETNVPLIWDYFETRGFPGWLFYRWDGKRHDLATQPGRAQTEGSANEIFNAWKDHIELNGHREVHLEFHEQCFDIREVMHDYDAFVAGGMALLENKDRVYSFEAQESGIDLAGFYGSFEEHE